MTNPVVFSAFISKFVCNYVDNVDDPAFASFINDKQGVDSIRYNALYDYPFEFTGDDTDQLALSLPGLLETDWVIIVAEVIGKGTIVVAGKDTDNSSVITAYKRGSGNTTYPGKIYYGGYNVTGVTLESNQDGTIIRGHVVVICSDTDPRYPS